MDSKRLKKLAGLAEQKVADENAINDEVVKLFTVGVPTVDQLQTTATNLGSTSAAVEAAAYKLLHSFLKKFGKHNSIADDKFDATQLAMGRKVELEHTSSPWIAELIAKDHLAELPDYYTKLAQLENDNVAAGGHMAQTGNEEE